MSSSEVRMVWHGEEYKRRAREGAVEGLDAGSQHLLGASLALVPWDEHTLEGTGVATVDASKLKAAVSYKTKYARRQHEELTWKHKAGRSAKFLEIPFHAEAAVIRAIIAARIRRKLAAR